jgi:V8-like Glu-specific endopeptidase
LKLLLSLFFIFSTASAFALPKAPFDALDPARLVHRKAFQNKTYNFEGIVKLSNCSGALVIFNGMPDTANALVMTNGHCIQKPGGFLNPGEVWINRPNNRAMRLFDATMKLHPIQATQITYATMTDTDLAFYELNQTYAQIKRSTGVRPFMLDSNRPFVGDEIELISGYWDRGWTCAIDAFVFKMKESLWSWVDSIRYTQECDTMGGTSGSPLIAKGERRVFGVNNTSNEKGEQCTLNNPCEVSETGSVLVQKGVRYGQQTYWVYSCLTPDFRLDLRLSQCQLPK